jgi:hypothetical protein
MWLEGGGKVLKVSPPYEIFVKGYPPPTWNGFFEEIFDFWLKKAIFSENVWDLLGLSQICSKIFRKILTPPTLKIFLNPYPPHKIFGQAHVLENRNQ